MNDFSDFCWFISGGYKRLEIELSQSSSDAERENLVNKQKIMNKIIYNENNIINQLLSTN